MPRIKHQALPPVAVKALVDRGTPGRHADGNGLYLHVTGAGMAKWSLRFMLNGKAREMGLGAVARGEGTGVRGVTLKEARSRAAADQVKIKAGIDPVAEREAKAEARRVAESGSSGGARGG